MVLNRKIITLLSRTAGYDVATPAGAEKLSHDILSSTGERISVNSLKRLTGVIEYEGKPRETTLDIIARYIGLSGHKDLMTLIADSSSAFNTTDDLIDTDELPTGVKIRLAWAPDRRLVIEKTKDGSFEVKESVNGKLRAGDILFLSRIGLNFPFKVKEVIRQGEKLGNYSAGMDEGLKICEIL